ncbi:MAG TPA: site-specific DNA-methyltransferase [Candidatus Taylorbacteria bacterium]|uniref:Site-specific DNA-methyltransferase (Adenine-specific) n=1 Tax=Candidatus Magasanikbacteria bacterium GW2011_GWA2_42_32 TaxID=1619039 RepID=A0A0G1D304_9BACT|nr:MAG: Site-specific DNA-methyltransferase (Adenine-specific) [Candidatus Magasanikbacteria bacterium GW2011_GWA2_42_32]KKU97227.1 MAG: Site-specific DNA-methyltransferase (Adenine-specific) [Parcubacteria group bacterium GW2011_GWC2_48_17]HBV01733.1 site-specific DNA-methyltransferase [Candidatus Taylorbacteria bacterium]
MATLQFKGKSAVWNHHLSVPYHTLEENKKQSLKGKDSDENLIIEGDNLLALKALLPKYQGRVKCIYIDPPYNTGNENWVYNDNVNSPTMQEWVGKAVAKDDLTRHDKWLCMMTPRLKLLKELLREDGGIFISIDYNEESRLRLLMDEIFDEGNYRNTFVVSRVKKNIQETEKVKAVNFGYNSVVFYARTDSCLINPPKRPHRKEERWHAFDAPGIRSTMEFEIFGAKPPQGRHWMYSKDLVDKMIKEGTVRKNPKTGSIQYLLAASDFTLLDTNWTDIQESDSQWDFLNGEKNVELIKRIIKMLDEPGAIILDSFAGSGTTAHAVLDLNRGGGDRKFILVEMESYANEKTAGRVRKVIKDSADKSGFTYYTLGPAIDAENLLSGKLPTYKEFAKYVYYLATGKNHPNEAKIKESDSLVGKAEHESIYLLYEKDKKKLKTLAITLDWAQKVHEKNSGRKIVYAPACYLDDEALEQYNIKFVSIPYNLFERNV